jgi:hypothetical protein
MDTIYFCAYHSFLKSIEPLNDAERGRLFTACLQYSETGVEPKLLGNERYVFPTIRGQIDRDKGRYEQKCETNRGNGALGGQATSERYQTAANATERPPNAPQEKEKEKNKDKGEKPNAPPTADAGDPFAGYPFSDGLKAVIADWFRYKAERRQAYKPTGQKSILSQIRNKTAELNEDQIIYAITESMACNYQGIIWDKVRNLKSGTSPPNSKYGFMDYARELRETETNGVSYDTG